MSSIDQQEKPTQTSLPQGTLPPGATGESPLQGKIRQLLLQDTHRAYTPEETMRALKLLSPKDPQKQAETLAEVTSILSFLRESGFCRDIALNSFKARLFFDAEKNIEHAFIGGMGNVHYRFNNAPVFRLNLGVLSLFFIQNEKAKCWRVCVDDSTIGKNYCLVRPLGNGVHVFGTDPKVGEGETGWVIEGKYIEKTHTTLTLSENQIEVADHRTLRGTRIDHLTDTGFEAYTQAANQFLKSTDATGQMDMVKRGRFSLEQLLQHHRNFETSFFSRVVDFILFKESR